MTLKQREKLEQLLSKTGYEFYILVKYFMGSVLDYCYGLRETTVCTKAIFSNMSSVPLIFLKGHYKRI